MNATSIWLAIIWCKAIINRFFLTLYIDPVQAKQTTIDANKTSETIQLLTPQWRFDTNQLKTL
jgi:hypothetical protein